jgi:hypothetical protein
MKNKNIKIFSYNKYSNKSCKCNQEHIHDSRGEARYCDNLALQKKIGEIKDYECQKNIDLIVEGHKICCHRVDFWITENDDKNRVEEYKGFATDVWNLKRKLFEAIYPGIPYIVIKG